MFLYSDDVLRCSSCANRSGTYCTEKHKHIHDNDYCNSYITESSCFFVTACINARNLPIDCEELMTLHDYRDSYVLKIPNGKKEIAIYYAISPKLIEAINKQKNSEEIYETIYTNLLVPCTELIKDKQYLKVYILFKGAILCLGKEYMGEDYINKLLERML